MGNVLGDKTKWVMYWVIKMNFKRCEVFFSLQGASDLQLKNDMQDIQKKRITRLKCLLTLIFEHSM